VFFDYFLAYKDSVFSFNVKNKAFEEDVFIKKTAKK